jgi:hypothetical protein
LIRSYTISGGGKTWGSGKEVVLSPEGEALGLKVVDVGGMKSNVDVISGIWRSASELVGFEVLNMSVREGWRVWLSGPWGIERVGVV